MSTEAITLEVDSEAARAFRSVSAEGREKLQVLLGIWLREYARADALSLKETMDEISRKVLSPMGEDEYMRVKLGKVGDRVIATPLSRGAGVIMSLVRADGLVTIPRLSEGLHPGTEIEPRRVALQPGDTVVWRTTSSFSEGAPAAR